MDEHVSVRRREHLMVKDLRREHGLGPRGLRAAGRLVFFRASAGVGDELWKSDGTEAGTVPVADIHPTASSSPADLTAVGSQLFFRANDGTNGQELWKSSGTGATLVGPINSTPNPAANANPSFLRPSTTACSSAQTTVRPASSCGGRPSSRLRPAVTPQVPLAPAPVPPRLPHPRRRSAEEKKKPEGSRRGQEGLQEEEEEEVARARLPLRYSRQRPQAGPRFVQEAVRKAGAGE